MGIDIKEITAENWIEAVKLKVKNDQESFVASNAVSLAQSKFHPFLECHGFFLDEEMVGFSATGKNPEDEAIWIARFMIGEKFQGKGYGKKCSVKLLEFLKEKHNCSEIFLDVAPENEVAIKMYESVGFKDTGKIQGKSKVFKLVFDK
ncbi:MAG: GNAT family N-acetyltransferase [Candidatus Heimdallarchaeota archaeon]|nr:GNAT family N-acetyltransferase [Candidatus Heimdallarchaeota archaeon]MCK4876765.1 GNAT family N-acetyltransferase [Candidatus Heimdallarchaeota archaeon]